MKALFGAFYLSEVRILGAVAKRTSFNLVHLASVFKVDVYLLGDDNFAREQLTRARRIPAPGGAGESFLIASPEDVVLQKLPGTGSVARCPSDIGSMRSGCTRSRGPGSTSPIWRSGRPSSGSPTCSPAPSSTRESSPERDRKRPRRRAGARSG